MTASYRLLLFRPNPFTGACFPLAAVLQQEGRISVVKAAHLPGPDCLGGRDIALTLRRLHARLDTIEAADALPPAFGPYTSLSDPRPVPAGAAPVEWLERLFARSTTTEADREPRGAHRSTYGHRFFETWHVARYVRKTFRADSDWNGWLSAHATGLEQVSHWVANPRELVLMEPIVPARAQFERELKEMATRFMAYRWAFEHVGLDDRKGRLIAYVTAGASQRRREQVSEALQGCATEVIDTEDDVARGEFISLVRRVGSDGTPQAPLFPEQ